MSDSRRDFVKTIAVVTVGAAALGDAGAIVVAPNKRPLTADEFNRRFAGLRGTAQFGLEMDEAKSDLLTYLARRFSLTPQQIQNIRSLPPADTGALNQALDRAVAEHLTLRLKLEDANCRRLRFQFSPGTLTIEAAAR